MKNFKVSILGIFAITLAVGASSFTTNQRPKPYADSWFLYSSGSMTSPASYTYSATVPTCAASTSLCAIKVQNDGSNHPDQTALTSLYNNNDQFSAPVQGLIKFKN